MIMRFTQMCGESLGERRMLTAQVISLGTIGVFESFEVVGQGSATTAIMADLNRDGNDDMVFGAGHRRAGLDDRHSSVGVLIADATVESGFRTGAEKPVHDDVMTLITTDLNQDGFLDLVVGGIYRLSVLLSEVNDLGEWAGLAEPNYIGGASENVVIEDFDGDGNLDIASSATYQWLNNPNPFDDPPHPSFANRDTVHTRIYAGDGQGGFDRGKRFLGSSFLVPTDIDSDGDLDFHTFLLDSEENTGEVTDFFTFVKLGRREYVHGVLINESEPGDILFRHAVLDEPFPYPEFQPNYVDINGDEYPDQIASQNSYDFGMVFQVGMSWYALGKADGEFEAPVFLLPWDIGNWREWGLPSTLPDQPRPIFVDVDDNGANDFVQLRGSRLTIMRQGLLEGFASEASFYSSETDRIDGPAFYDVNGDELIDFVFEGRVFEQKSDRGYRPPYAIGTEATLSDSTITDPLEIDVRQLPGGVDVVLHEGNGSSNLFGANWVTKFQIPVPSKSFFWSTSPVFNPAGGIGLHVDVDDDGDRDVVVAHDGGVTIVLAIGEGDFDRDGELTEKDFTLLRDARSDEQRSDVTLAAMDFDDDGQISTDDEQHWIANIAKTREGDLNLDGTVDFRDFLVISANYGLETNSLSDGDVDGDGIVSDSDFEILRANFGL